MWYLRVRQESPKINDKKQGHKPAGAFEKNPVGGTRQTNESIQ